MPSLAAAQDFNASYKPPGSDSSSSPPVAVFVGGTSGIGAAMVSSLTTSLKGDVDVYIVGRNESAAKKILDSLPAAPATSGTDTRPRVRDFVKCDAMLMKDVDQTTEELKKKVEKVNYLVMSQGILTTQGRTETEEGIDQKLALHYYSRWKFAYDLMPLVQKAKNAGEDGKVMSVLGAGYGGTVDLNDLGLKKKYSVAAAGLQGTSYNDCMIESFAKLHPTLSFIHVSPGFVRTNLASSSNSGLLRCLSPVFTGLSYAFGTSPENCATMLTYGIFKASPGWTRMNNKGEDIGNTRLYTSEEVNKAVWEHTIQETRTQA